MHFKKYVRFLALRNLYFTAFCLIISAGVLLPYMVLSSPAFCAVEPTVTPLPMVHVEEGLLAGFEEDDVIKFLGVPYAQPPVDDLRWKPPQPLLTWDGLKYAQKFAPSCPQPLLYNEPTSEDCLYLNIWTPSLDGSLPVMVWIHGGFFSRGSGSLFSFDGTTFAQTKRVLLITINYRLGAFGFLAHPALSSESALHTSGNYGLLDQVAALQWIQKNIRQFGGDPHNITIFGQSAGSMSVSALCLSPLAKGLFHKAIGQSGTILGNYALFPRAGGSLTEAEATGLRFEEELLGINKINPLEELRNIPAKRIVEKTGYPQVGSNDDYQFAPIFDNYMLPSEPRLALEKGAFNKVAILFGTNNDEGTAFYSPMTADEYSEWIYTHLHRAAPTAFLFFPTPRDEETFLFWPSLAGFTFFGEPTQTFVYEYGKRNLPAYLYLFDHTPSPFLNTKKEHYGAMHGAEIPYVFGHISKEEGYKDIDIKMSQKMMEYWIRFAENGDPNRMGTLFWPKVDANMTRKDLPYMVISSSPHITRGILAQLAEALHNER